MREQYLKLTLIAVIIVGAALGAYALSEVHKLKKELVEAKTQVVEKLVIDHNSVTCN
jgi:hypothetical protein